jgi:hypothetical protein
MTDAYKMTVDFNVLDHPGINLSGNSLNVVAATVSGDDGRLKESSCQ